MELKRYFRGPLLLVLLAVLVITITLGWANSGSTYQTKDTSTVVQMIDVGEESGKLDEMLLKVADIEERQLRARTKVLLSLLAPILILIVGALVGFMVIAILLPIFRISRAIH